MAVDIITDHFIEGMRVTKGMVIEIRTMGGLEKGIQEGVAQEKVPNPGVAVDLKTEMRVGDRVGKIPEIETDLNQDPDHLFM